MDAVRDADEIPASSIAVLLRRLRNQYLYPIESGASLSKRDAVIPCVVWKVCSALIQEQQHRYMRLMTISVNAFAYGDGEMITPFDLIVCQDTTESVLWCGNTCL